MERSCGGNIEEAACEFERAFKGVAAAALCLNNKTRLEHGFKTSFWWKFALFFGDFAGNDSVLHCVGNSPQFSYEKPRFAALPQTENPSRRPNPAESCSLGVVGFSVLFGFLADTFSASGNDSARRSLAGRGRDGAGRPPQPPVEPGREVYH